MELYRTLQERNYRLSGMICSCLLNVNVYPYSVEMSDEKVQKKERGNFITKKIRTGDIPKNDARYSRYHDHDWAVVKRVKEMCLIRDPSKRPSLLQLGEIMNTELDLYQSIRLKLHQGTAIESAQDDNIRK